MYEEIISTGGISMAVQNRLADDEVLALARRNTPGFPFLLARGLGGDEAALAAYRKVAEHATIRHPEFVTGAAVWTARGKKLIDETEIERLGWSPIPVSWLSR
jgi:hypothetical protein